jgi:hypothetical protein
MILREKSQAVAGKSCARSSQTENAGAAFCYWGYAPYIKIK